MAGLPCKQTKIGIDPTKWEGKLKILVCVGSYRKNGNTAQIAGLLQDQSNKITASDNETMEIENE